MPFVFIPYNPFRQRAKESGGALQCPICGPKDRKIRFVEDLGPYMRRYRCMKCGLYFRHDRSLRMPLGDFARLKKKQEEKRRIII